MTAPHKYSLAVQLYSLRDRSAKEFDQVLQDVAAMGYQGVEPFNLFGMTPLAFRERLNALGLTLAASHFPWANRTDFSELVDTLGALGLTRAVGGFMPDDFVDADALARTIETTAALQERLQSAGISLCLHNHWWEYRLQDDVPVYYALQDVLPTLEFEIDTYWAANFGARDPAAEVARVSDRAPLLHIKDGPLVAKQSHTAVGTGKMPIREVIAAADATVLEWLVVELDACDTDVTDAVAASARYLDALGVVAR